MNKLRLSIAVAGAALALWGSPRLNAHDEGKEGGKEEHEGWGKERGERWMKDMGLSDAEAEKMMAAWKTQMEAMKPLMEKQKLDIDSLRVLVDKKASDKDLTAAIAAVKADHQAIEEQQKKHREAMAAMLSPMQQAKMIISMGEMGERMMGKMGMHGGKGGDWKEKWGKGKGKDDDDHDEKEEHEHKDGGKY